jgi:hypothetical protein
MERTVNGDGTFTDGATLTTVAAVGWVFSTTSTTGLLDVLSGPGHAGPAHLIIGPPGPGSLYGNANGSIAGNGPHNPYLAEDLTFTITAPNVTADTTVTGATFSFGVVAGDNVPGIVPTTPDGGTTALLLSLSLLALGIFAKRRTVAKAV